PTLRIECFEDRITPTALTVTINQDVAQVDPTINQTIHFTAVFSESVTGFAANDVILGGTAGATTVEMTGSSTTYDVAVSGMTQSGTVTATVPANAAADVSGDQNIASTS